MSKQAAGPPFPDNPGAWIACFRHRIKVKGKPASPECFGRLIGRSGATVRRWESNAKVPNEQDIARMAEVCRLTDLQVAFLSAACTRVRAMPAPNRGEFEAFMREELCSIPYPAVLLDSLYYARAWNSYVEVLARGASRAFARDTHPLASLLRAAPAALSELDTEEGILRSAIRSFWVITASRSHRPEYKEMLSSLKQEPEFRRLWMDLALCDAAPRGPVNVSHSFVGSGSNFRVYSRTIVFPPTYYLQEYHPEDEAGRRRLQAMIEEGPPKAHFHRELHWVKAPPVCW